MGITDGYQQVQAPPLAPPRVGLLPSAPDPVADLGWSDRWTVGVAYTSEDTCGTTPQVSDPCSTSSGDLDLDVEPAAVQWEPYVVSDGVTCTTLSPGARMWSDLARRRLAGSEGAQIELELWEGARARASSWPNEYLANGTALDLTSGVAAAATDALGLLQQYLAETMDGRRGMIHATRTAITAWTSLDLLRREGRIIFDIFDNIVVPGGGYTGSGPAATDGGAPVAAADGSVWAYATGLVWVARDEVVVDDLDWRTVDRSTNDVEIRAQRHALAFWDTCAHAAVEMDLAVVPSGS